MVSSITFFIEHLKGGKTAEGLLRLLEYLKSQQTSLRLSIITREPAIASAYIPFFKEHNICHLSVFPDTSKQPKILKKWRLKWKRRSYYRAVMKHIQTQDVLVDYADCQFFHEFLITDSKALKIGWYHSPITAYMKQAVLRHRMRLHAYNLFVCPSEEFAHQLVEFDSTYAGKVRVLNMDSHDSDLHPFIKMLRYAQRVGILNFHFEGENYGAILTSYALCKYLNDLGYNTKNIDYIAEFYYGRTASVNLPSFEKFRTENLPMTAPVLPKHAAWLNHEFDAFIVGSDQVFNTRFIRGERNMYYLGFTHKPKIAFSASFGTDSFEGTAHEFKNIREHLRQFHRISLREDSGVAICRDQMGLSAQQIADPVLLIDWDHLCPADYPAQDRVWYLLRKNIAHLSGGQNMYQRKEMTVQDWLGAIKHAGCMITDSFHGTLFSIIFSTPFVPVAPPGVSTARMRSLLSMFHLPEDAILPVDKKTPIDTPWEKHALRVSPEQLAPKLEILRKAAHDFITHALDN